MPSSVIRDFRYIPDQQKLEILFVTGRRYSYYNVPGTVYDEMRQAFSKGEFFNARIRGRYRFTLDAGRLRATLSPTSASYPGQARHHSGGASRTPGR